MYIIANKLIIVKNINTHNSLKNEIVLQNVKYINVF